MLLFLARASGGQSHRLPIGRLISDALKTARFHKSFQKLPSPAVLGRPIRRALCPAPADITILWGALPSRSPTR